MFGASSANFILNQDVYIGKLSPYFISKRMAITECLQDYLKYNTVCYIYVYCFYLHIYILFLSTYKIFIYKYIFKH